MIEELVFWKQSPDCAAWPWDIHTALCNGDRSDGVMELETDRIIEQIEETFRGGQRTAETLQWSSAAGGGFWVSWSRLFVRARLFRLDKRDHNRLIDIFAEFECPAYDVDLAERYGLQDGPTRNLQQDYVAARLDYLRSRGDYVYENSPEHNHYLAEHGWWNELAMGAWLRF